MLYRIRLDLAFDTEDIPQTVFDKAKKVLLKAVKIANEVSYIEIHKCFHDEDPTKPCEMIKRIEV